ncbi:hypothetical protein [Halomonas lysinitropha]|uniref:Uncharacterized protein n=1 Tax=Halomonas lysinitropha TaxID=2607506 RepID=A0A5K1IAQ9_9GAMM|nr:hypothetical protein [Halomonas lysinitropha]VVZ97300.1 hypothetical protein HALO32_03417 [Halomonas lysinitropha]
MSLPSINDRIDPLATPPSPQPGEIALTEDVLGQANGHEHHAYHRYRWLSLRFLTYSIGISRLMQALAEESRQRIQALIEQSSQLTFSQPVARATDWEPPSLPSQSHFFILDDAGAAQAISLALLEEWQSRRFYERLHADNGTPQLDGHLKSCIGQAQAQFQVLKEAEWLLPTPPREHQEMYWTALRYASSSEAANGHRPRPGHPDSPR